MDLEQNTAEAFEREIEEDEPVLELLKGDAKESWHWLRYPYLHEGDTVEKRRAVRAYLKAHGYRIAQVTLDWEDYLWNFAYARCAAKKDKKAVASLHDSYLATADEYITYSRTLSQRLYGRDIPYVLLLHVGAFDAKMLPELIGLFRKRGFDFVTLPQAESDPAYSVDPKVAYPGGGLLMELLASTRKVDMPNATEPEDALAKMCR